jgi:hypothetical protein
MQYSKGNRFNQTAWQNQAQYSFKILTINIGIGVQSNSQEMAPSANASYKKVAKQMRAPRSGKRVVQENALKPWARLWPWMSQLSQQGVFKMTKVLSVNDRAKVGEIKKVAERFVISHQHKKVRS